MSLQNNLLKKLESFISKYYKNMLLKGAIYFFSASLLFFILVSAIEYVGNFGVLTRTVLFWILILAISVLFWKWILIPLKGVFRIGKTLTHQEAAKIIGEHFSEVQDRLINLIQLSELSSKDNELIDASIEQKSKLLKPISFSTAIDFSKNKKHLKGAALPITILILLFLSGNQNLIKEGSYRVLAHNTHFTPKAPFYFIINNKDLSCTKGEDFSLIVSCVGPVIPDKAYIYINGSKNRLTKNQNGFSYLFKNIQKNTTFQFWADGYYFEPNELVVIPKPTINEFKVTITPPEYTNNQTRVVKNIGNLEICEGSSVSWEVKVNNADNVYFSFNEKLLAQKKSESHFIFKKSFKKSTSYKLYVSNSRLFGDSVFYHINVIEDDFPKINVAENIDSTNSYLRHFSGIVQDDYGLTRLTFNYRLLEDSENWIKKEISLDKKDTQQAFSYYLDLESTGLLAAKSIEYFFEVWDNDEINGNKSSRSDIVVYNAPSLEEAEKNISESNEKIKDNLDKSIELTKDLRDGFDEFKKQLLEKKQLSWGDKQKVSSLLEKQKDLTQQIESLQKQQKTNKNQKNQFKDPNENLLKKQKALEELFENIMSEDLKKMMQDLEEMMQEIDKDQLLEMLEEMEKNDETIEDELDRVLEVFKQMEVQQKMETAVEDLKQLIEKQQKAAEATEKITNKKHLTTKEQEALKNEFEKIENDLKKAEELNESLEEKNKFPNVTPEIEEIKQEMNQSMQSMQKKLQKKAAQSQKKSAQKMKGLLNKIESALQQSYEEGAYEDMEVLRQILENLITLSLSQEELLLEITLTNINSPLYTSLIRQQKKLQEDAEIIKDSLFALSKRQPQISAAVNREMKSLYQGMEKSITYMEERLSNKSSEKQQFVMTAANNLSLLLSEILKQMQQQLSQQNKSESQKMCNKPNSSGGQSMQDLKSMQQSLKKQLEKMIKEGKGKKGGKMNKQLAQMAAKQEMMRHRMQQLREEMSGNQNAKKNIDEILKQMEQNEIDLVNKNITRKTLLRQEDIFNRLLKAEKAQREQEQEKTRESQEWINDFPNRLEKTFKEYEKIKENQEELLRTVPASLTPFYKIKVTNFFQDNE